MDFFKKKISAQFVDIIHTDAGVCGTSWSVGHIGM